ncbi:hypothetical protein F5Y19DRAFT_471275 [Xylariaceae sp. FL1651]|nr:hypothetical protein F5Y19DRAFT_471275 [Xylariaceae sp. FL1651]
MGDSTQIPPEVLQGILDGPSALPPEGVIANFDNPTNGNAGAIALAVICFSLASTAGSIRAYSRIFVVKKVQVEDFLGIAAFGFYAGTAWCYFRYLLDIGFFVHQWDLKGFQLTKILYIVFILYLVYQLTMVFAKVAILLEWSHIFSPDRTSRSFFWTSRFLMVITVLFYLANIISVFLTCTPFERNFHFWVQGTCIDQRARDIVIATFNLALDIFIFLLPQRTIWTLQMSTRRKFGISLVFSVGLLACVSAAGRVAPTIENYYPKSLAETYDSSYIISQLFLWVIAEQTCVLLVFCVPAIPKVFAQDSLGGRLLRSLRSWTRLLPTSKSNHSPPGTDERAVGWSFRTIGGTAPNGLRVYRKMDEQATMESSTELGVMSPVDIEDQTKSTNRGVLDSGIIKTTEFDQREDHGSQLSVDPSLEHQHPWMDRS